MTGLVPLTCECLCAAPPAEDPALAAVGLAVAIASLLAVWAAWTWPL